MDLARTLERILKLAVSLSDISDRALLIRVRIHFISLLVAEPFDLVDIFLPSFPFIF